MDQSVEVQVESDVRLIFSNITSSDPEAPDCKEQIQRLTALFSKPQEKIGILLPILFNGAFGLDKSVLEGLKRKGKKNITKQILKICLKVAESYAQLLFPYSGQIQSLCCCIGADSTLFTLGCEIFISLSQKAAWIFTDVRDIFQNYQSRLYSWSNAMDESKGATLFQAIESIIIHYPHQLYSCYEQFFDLIVSKMQEVNQKMRNPCLKLLLKLTKHYVPNTRQCDALYFFLDSEVKKDLTLKSFDEDLLQFFSHFASILHRNLTTTYEFWHRTLLDFMVFKQSSEGDSKLSDEGNPMHLFCRNILTAEIENKPEMLKYFYRFFTNTLEKKELQYYDCDCLILWSYQVTTLLDPPAIDKFLNVMLKFILISFPTDRKKVRCHLSCAQSAFILLSKDATLFRTYHHVFADILIVVLASYEDVDDCDVHTLLICFLNLSNTVSRRDILKEIVYLILLKQCSRKWPVFPGKKSWNSRCYLFWKKFFDEEFFCKNDLFGLKGYTVEDAQRTQILVWNSLIVSIFYLGNTLNFKTFERSSEALVETQQLLYKTVLEAECPGDITLFSNVIQLFICLVDDMPSSVAAEWATAFLLESITLSSAHPYISAFCRLVMVGLQIQRMITGNLIYPPSFSKRLHSFISSCFQQYLNFRGDLQRSYIILLLGLPAGDIISFKDYLTPLFLGAFQLATTNEELAVCIVQTLRRWIVGERISEMRSIVLSLIPSLASVAKIYKGVELERGNVRGTVEFELHREISILLSQLDCELVEEFYASFRYGFGTGKFFKLQLSARDRMFDVNIGNFLPELLLLAFQSADQKERVRSCEFLHFIVSWMLGKSASVDESEYEAFSSLFKRLIDHVLILMSDPSHHVRRIFKPLATQLVNLFSYKLISEEFNRAFVEAVFVSTQSCRSESLLKFCCDSLKTLVRSGISYSDNFHRFNLDCILNLVAQNFLHPDITHRQSAFIVLHSIQDSLWFEQWSFDKYCFLVIYLGVSSLSLFNENDEHALHILRGFKKSLSFNSTALHKDSEARVIPPGLRDSKVESMILWLTSQAVSYNSKTTTECTDIISRLAVSVSDLKNLYAEKNAVSQSLNVFAEISRNADTPELNHLLTQLNVACHIEFFYWLIVSWNDKSLFEMNDFVMVRAVGVVLKNVERGKLSSPRNPGIEDIVTASLKFALHLENSSTLGSGDALQVLRSLVNVSSLFERFLIAPSSLGVTYGTNSYRELWDELWRLIESRAELSSSFWRCLLPSIDAFLADLPASLHNVSYLSDCHLEVLDCINSLMNYPRSDQSCWPHGTNIIKRFSDAFKCSELRMCSPGAFHYHGRSLANFCSFALTLGPFEEVLEVLFQSVFSDEDKADRFYSQFEHIILSFVNRNIDEHHFHLFGLITSGGKIHILNRMVSKSGALGNSQKFPVCLMKSLTAHWYSVIEWAQDGEHLSLLLECLYNLGNSFPSPAACFVETPFEPWLKQRLKIDPPISAHVLWNLAPFFGNAFYDELMSQCMGSTNIIDAVSYLLTANLVKGSSNLAPYWIDQLFRNNSSFAAVCNLMRPLFFSFSVPSQQLILSRLFMVAVQCEESHPLESEFEYFLMAVPKSVRRQFYSKHMEKITEVIFAKVEASQDLSARLSRLSSCFLLVRIMYGSFDTDEMFGNDGFVTRILGNISNNCTVKLIKRCYEIQKLKTSLWSPSPPSPSELETWRRCQCNALNCLLVLLCHSKLTSKALHHFVFRDQSEPVLEMILDQAAAPQFISWMEAKNTKKGKKIVETGIKLSKPSQFRGWSSSLTVSLTSISQDCKVFDFIGHTGVTPLEGLTSVIEMEGADGDSLDQHECIAFLVSTIKKTVECGMTPLTVGQAMPEWMTGLNGILRNPCTSLPTRAFIVKIVFKCIEAFEPYAASWYHPILYALTTDACGDGLACFFYQVARKLIEWQPYASGSEMETKLWSSTLEKVFACFTSACSVNEMHLLDTITSIVETRKDVLPPYTLIMRLLMVKIELVLNITLKSCCVLFENNIHPVLSEEREQFYNILRSALDGDSTCETAACLIGYFVKTSELDTQRERYIDSISSNLTGLNREDKGKFLLRLKGMSQSFPQIAEGFIHAALAILEKPKLKALHSNSIAVILNYISHFPTPEIFHKLKQSRFLEVLASGSMLHATKRSGLMILKYFSESGHPDIREDILNFLRLNIAQFSSYNLRLQVFEIILDSIQPSKNDAGHFASGSSCWFSVEIRKWLSEQLLTERSYAIHNKLTKFLGGCCVWQCSSEELALQFLDALLLKDFNHDAMRILTVCFLERSRGALSEGDTLFSHPIAEISDKGSLLPVDTCDDETEVAKPLFIETVDEGHGLSSDADLSLEPPILSSHEKKEITGRSRSSPENEGRKTLAENVYLRTYKYGVFPDVQVPVIELILILLSHCRSNLKIAGKLFTDIFSSIFSCKVDMNLQQRFKNMLPNLLAKFCHRKINSRAVSFILELCWVNDVAVDPILLHDVCQTFKLRELGILTAENLILSQTSTKRFQFQEVASSAHHAYHYNLAIFMEDLKFSQIKKSILNMIYPGLERHLTVERELSMGTVYSHYVNLKEMSLLGDWKLLDEEMTRVNRDPANSRSTNLFSRMHFDFQVLAAINLKLEGVESSSFEKVTSWLRNKEMISAIEQTQWGNRSFLLFLCGQIEDFKSQSELDVFSLAQTLALDEEFVKRDHGASIVMILNNYLMSIALDETDGAQFYSQLQHGRICVSDDLVGWHQLIVHKERFLEYLGEKNESSYSFERSESCIQRLRKEYIRRLISLRKIEAAKACISKYFEDSSAISLESSMIHLWESKEQNDKKLKNDFLWKSWTFLDASSEMSHDAQMQQHLSDICCEFLYNLHHNEEFDKKKLRASLGSQSPTFRLDEAVVIFGFQSHLKTISLASALEKASCYVRTAEFCLRHREDTSDEVRSRLDENSVSCILKSMALGCKSGIDLFPKVLNLVILNPTLSAIFNEECSKIEPSFFEFWLPQIIGGQNVKNAFVLEPLLMRLADSFRQKLFLLLYPVKDDLVTENVSAIFKVWKKLCSDGSGQNFIDSLGSVCHPNLLLKTLATRLVQARSLDQATLIYHQIKEKCFFHPHRGMLTGKLYLMNNKYLDTVDQVYGEIVRDGVPYPPKKAAEIVGSIEVEHLDGYLMLESFSPYLSSFDSRAFKFDIPSTSPGSSNGSRPSVSLIGFSPKVAVIESLRKPMKIEMLGSDGLSHSIIVKFGDNLRRDQCVQQLFAVMNASMRRSSDWEGETINTYNVLPLTMDFGLIEMVNSAVTMSALIDANSNDGAKWRNTLKTQHANWIIQASRESAYGLNVTNYAQAAAFYSESDIALSLSSLSSSVPGKLLSVCMMKHAPSPKDYFHQRHRFLRSHALMSAYHWILGVGDRHLGNILFSMSTCELIGIDFTFSFGAATERSPIPEFVPFRLTPQFSEFYSLYKIGILKHTIIKCLTSIDAETVSLVAQLFGDFSLPDCPSRDGGVANVDDRTSRTKREVSMVQRKLSLEDPVNILKDHLKAGHHNERTVNIYERLLDRISRPSLITSFDQIADVLIDISSNPSVLGVAYSVFEPWI